MKLNQEDLFQKAKSLDADKFRAAQTKPILRVMGIATRQIADETQIFVSHHFWHDDQVAKSVRVSRLIITDTPALLAGTIKIKPSDWSILFDSSPLIKISLDQPSPFLSTQTGGRITFTPEGQLLLSIGDHRYDGLTVPFMASQNNSSPYGKILEIDPDSGNFTLYAKGLRNSQGLMFDREGNLWATDHGPRGGDELNRIVRGGNYGWPIASYGTDYGSFTWPFSQGHTVGQEYTEPVYSWVPSVGISNVIQIQNYTKAWDGDLLVSSMVRGTLFRIRLFEGRVVFSEPILIGERIRDLLQMEDGTIVLWVDGARFIELRPSTDSGFPLHVPLTPVERKLGLRAILAECASCHGFIDKATTAKGPILFGIVGRRIAESQTPDIRFTRRRFRIMEECGTKQA